MEAFEELKDPREGKAKRHYFGEVLFIAHVRSIRPDLADEFIAFDGKTLRHSFDHGDPENSLHLISAWADGCGLSLGQLLVDGKSNEITAVPKLLRQLDVKGADYLDWLEPAERKLWLGLRSIVEVTSTRETKGVESIEKRYYLTSRAPEAERLGELVRRYWGIENRCHPPSPRLRRTCWVLDMTFGEDGCRVRKGHAAENLALLRKLALNPLRHDRTIKDTMRGNRIRAALCEDTLETLMKLKLPE